ncbi:MAG: 4-hydroxybenzoate polyprenyltransferase [Tenuifilum sp.]|jgi:4-hydroxybenzoate polyprenyltransferase|uniref:UbiA-like polyprenyltransferase n=1 Tax=Tenuifilum sp. TaxID=2760880 RepID=UPI0024AADF60|nr:UbiA-like polyprenyltransferase [Tenuifilum sp.]MDI3527553.1 4-hydroxybenzoate polyprenyltransferase [Tenuifilum sp.]
MLIKVKNYLSLVKFSHTIFAMPFAIIGYFLAYYKLPLNPDLSIFLKVILCMVFARNAAMSFNRLIDKHFDKLNPRTKEREIPKGIITEKPALIFIILNSILFIATTYFINNLVFYLSPIALFVVLFYSYTKRFTMLSHIVLGLGLSLAPIGAYLSVTARFEILPLLYSFLVLFWVAGFDIIYALQDEDFDKKHKLHSIPAAVGRKWSLFISFLLHFISIILVIAIGLIAAFNYWYWIGASLFIGLMLYQHYLVKPTDISKVNMAFATTNGLASIVFATFNIISILTV